MPRISGKQPVEIHWQAMTLPGSESSPKVPDGFRDNEKGRWQAELRASFRDNHDLPLVLTDNWHPDRTQARGRLQQDLRERFVGIIGVGALGSAVAELLVRAGVQRTLLVDGDALVMGNLVRHSLDLRSLGKKKATAVAEKLRLVAPMAEVSATDRYLPLDPEEVHDLLQEVDIVIDCTADDSVVHALGGSWWARPKLFVNASVGYRAERVFIFTAAGSRFPAETFLSEISPWLAREREAWGAEGETLEGAGCWSPLFPARVDDLWLAAVATVKRVESALAKRSFGPELEVLGVVQAGGCFEGLAHMERA